MLAVVMSGAANFGAMQAGALEALLGVGLKPEMTVGTSAGSLNAIYFAANPTPEGVERLQDLWRSAGPEEIGFPKPLEAIRRLVQQQDSIVPNDHLVRFLRKNLPQGVETFGQLVALHGVRAYAVAVCMDDGALVVFGDRDQDRLIDGAMASTAIPPYFPPWECGKKRYIDGGVYAKLPIRPAIERGADQIIALDVSYAMGSPKTAHGILGISGYALSLMVEAQTTAELAHAKSMGVSLRVLRLLAPLEVPFWDYSKADFLIRRGRELAQQALIEKPVRFPPAWYQRLRSGLAGLRMRDR